MLYQNVRFHRRRFKLEAICGEYGLEGAPSLAGRSGTGADGPASLRCLLLGNRSGAEDGRPLCAREARPETADSLPVQRAGRAGLLLLLLLLLLLPAPGGAHYYYYYYYPVRVEGTLPLNCFRRGRGGGHPGPAAVRSVLASPAGGRLARLVAGHVSKHAGSRLPLLGGRHEAQRPSVHFQQWRVRLFGRGRARKHRRWRDGYTQYWQWWWW